MPGSSATAVEPKRDKQGPNREITQSTTAFPPKISARDQHGGLPEIYGTVGSVVAIRGTIYPSRDFYTTYCGRAASPARRYGESDTGDGRLLPSAK